MAWRPGQAQVLWTEACGEATGGGLCFSLCDSLHLVTRCSLSGGLALLVGLTHTEVFFCAMSIIFAIKKNKLAFQNVPLCFPFFIVAIDI